MSHFTLAVSSSNPVKTEHLLASLAAITPPSASSPLTLPDNELESYTKILAGAHDSFSKILALDDYIPQVDEERFPRTDVHFRGKDESTAWAWKTTVRDVKEDSVGGLLKGKTICLKDNITLKGVPCLLGTDAIQDWVPQTDATVVTRVLEAGGVITGKATCENLSFFAASFTAATGPIDNAYAPGYSAGGSSSGTGVLVANSETWGGIGGDQGGSIRIPAAHNGIVGMKPTGGLVPYTGIATLEPVIDVVGPMTRTVLDNARLLRVLAGADGIDDRQLAGCPLPHQVPDYEALSSGGVKGMRIGIIKESLTVATHYPRISAQVVEAAKKFESLGATVEEVSLPEHLIGPELYLVAVRLSGTQHLLGKGVGRRALYLNDLTSKLVPLTQDKFDKMIPSVKVNLTNGQYAFDTLDPTLYGKAMNNGRRVRDAYNAALSKYDVLITPTVPWVPKKWPHADATPLEKMSTCAGVTINTCPLNLTGHPALSLPVGFMTSNEDSNVKLPTGMQIIGKFYDEGIIYRVARAWEEANDWKSVVV